MGVKRDNICEVINFQNRIFLNNAKECITVVIQNETADHIIIIIS